jgi:hypothetical protein
MHNRLGSSGSVNATVLDPTGAVVPGATVEIHNPVSHFDRWLVINDWFSGTQQVQRSVES